MAFELEAGPPLTALPLIPTSEVHTRTLLVHRDTAETGVLRLTEQVVSYTATTSATDHFGYRFRIQRDTAVPLYTLKEKTQPDWAIELICDGTPLVFSVADRQDILELQRFITGYEVKDTFWGGNTWARFKGSKRRLRGKAEHDGVAEIQLWEWPDERHDNTQLSPTTTRSSQSQTAASSMAPSLLSVSDAVTVHTDRRTGRSAVFTEVNPPPLLVFFLQEECQYTMLSIDVSTIETSDELLKDGWLEMCNSVEGDPKRSQKRPPMEARLTSASRSTEGLKSWNLCSMATANIAGVDSRICERLLVRFDDAAETETERFEKALLNCRLRQSEKTKEKNMAFAAVANSFRAGGLESRISPRSSRMFTPPRRESRASSNLAAPVMSPGMQYFQGERFSTATAPAMSSALQNRQSAQFPLAPPRGSGTPHITTIIPDHWLEMGSDRPVRELDGTSMPTAELPGSTYRHWRGR